MDYILRKIRLQIKIIGINIFVPIPSILLTVLLAIKANVYNLDQQLFVILELFIPFCSAFSTIFFLKEIFEVSGNELFFAIEKNRRNFGIYKLFYSIIFYSVILLLGIFLLDINLKNINFIAIYTHLLICGIFLSSISFFITIIFKNTLINISLIIIYISSMLFIGEVYFPNINIFIFSNKINDIHLVLINSIKFILASILIIFITQKKINKLDEFNT